MAARLLYPGSADPIPLGVCKNIFHPVEVVYATRLSTLFGA